MPITIAITIKWCKHRMDDSDARANLMNFGLGQHVCMDRFQYVFILEEILLRYSKNARE